MRYQQGHQHSHPRYMRAMVVQIFEMSTTVTALFVAGMVGLACSSSGLKSRAGDAGAASGGQAGSTISSGTTGGTGGTIGPGGGAGADGADDSTGEACGCYDAQGHHLPPYLCPCPIGPPACPIPSLPCEPGYQVNPDPCAFPTCAYCGDGILEPGEECDLGELNGKCLDAQGCPTKDYCCPLCLTDCVIALCLL
jgi:hypothetical protein